MDYLLGSFTNKKQAKLPQRSRPVDTSKSQSTYSSKHGKDTPMIDSNESIVSTQDDSEGAHKSRTPVTSREIKIKGTSEHRLVLQKKDEEIEELKSHYHHLWYTCKNQEANNSNLTQTIAAAEHEIQGLRQQHLAAQRDLQACKDDLFRLQPLAQVPDSNIAKDYDLLCLEIMNWIDGEITSFEKSNRYTEPEQLFSSSCDSELSLLLQNHPDCGEYFVRFLIHSCLNEFVFGDDVYLLGLSAEATKFLQRAEQGMGALEPKRDHATINAWRSETVRALAASKAYERERKTKAQDITERLIDTLSAFFPVVRGNHESKKRLFNQVIVPSADLAFKINGSVSRYEFIMETDAPLQPEHVYLDYVRYHRLINVKSRKTLKPDSGLTADREGRIGTRIMPLEPELRRVDADGKTVELRQDSHLVYLHQPLIKRGRGSF